MPVVPVPACGVEPAVAVPVLAAVEPPVKAGVVPPGGAVPPAGVLAAGGGVDARRGGSEGLPAGALIWSLSSSRPLLGRNTGWRPRRCEPWFEPWFEPGFEPWFVGGRLKVGRRSRVLLGPRPGDAGDRAEGGSSSGPEGGSSGAAGGVLPPLLGPRGDPGGGGAGAGAGFDVVPATTNRDRTRTTMKQPPTCAKRRRKQHCAHKVLQTQAQGSETVCVTPVERNKLTMRWNKSCFVQRHNFHLLLPAHFQAAITCPGFGVKGRLVKDGRFALDNLHCSVFWSYATSTLKHVDL